MAQRGRSILILMADDDAEDRMMMADAFAESHLAIPLRFVEDGEQLMDYLFHRGSYTDPASAPRPGLILLDLNMPKKNGWKALQEIKNDPTLRHIPIVILTTSKSELDVYRSYDLGVNSFITKPVTLTGLVEVVTILGKYWFEIVDLPADHTRKPNG
jgi:two-component system, response regulator